MSSSVADQVLPTLKPFQRATVEHAFERLYSPTGSGRFLVADEVGLGKTMVAKGIIAKAIDRLESDGSNRMLPPCIKFSCQIKISPFLGR